MTVHVLHAGDGYTYLTRQVASDDITRSSNDPLVAYYQAAGNPPGQWVGSGCVDVEVSGVVTEEQMLALFGEGLRPDANEFIAARMAEGVHYRQALAAARLGRKFYSFANDVPLAKAVQAAYEAFERRYQRRPSVEERRGIKEKTARSFLIHASPEGSPPSVERVREYIADELGRTRFPVSGFDLAFSPVKSASVLWALGGHRVRFAVERAHEKAWRGALAYGEREAAFTRAGAGGVAFLGTSGFIGAAFTHRDSRAGDPDLHTHVAVANRVLGEDGRWRTIDSRQLHRVAVSMSERYNSLLEQYLVDELGVEFVDVVRSPGKRPVREIAGIPAEWVRGFSRRRTQIEGIYEDLVREYIARHGVSPPRSVQHQLAQQATLTSRPTKQHLRTLAEQVEEWTEHARTLTPGLDIRDTINAALHHTPRGNGNEVSDSDDREPLASLQDVAQAVITRVGEGRSNWRVYHVRAEAERQLRDRRFVSAQQRIDAVEDVTRLALNLHSVLLGVNLDATTSAVRNSASGGAAPVADLERPLDVDDSWLGAGAVDVPVLLRRRDGASVFRRRGSNLHTSKAILAAEARLVAEASQRRGAALADTKRDAVVARWETTRGIRLGAGQRALVEQFVSSGAALAVAIGPPGAGKSMAMAAVRAAWESTGGRIIGLAPSAAAASVLGTELRVKANTMHSLLAALRAGRTVDVRRGDMLLVDEAGMAGTLILDQIRALAADRGAVVRLVGDHRQLSAVEAGGALRLLYQEVGGTVLTTLHRFDDPAEAEAILRLRVGDHACVPFYKTNQRLTGGVRAVVLDLLYTAWTIAVGAGEAAIMVADQNDVARELSDRAQADRRAAGAAEDGGVELREGAVAGVGDRIVTRFNDRRLATLGGKDFVKNGDLWDVVHRFDDGRLFVRHTEHGGTIMLPATYVASFVELGYAASIHRSQGLNVDACYAFLSPQAVREALLVAASRGRRRNQLYFDTESVLHPDEPETLPGDLYYRYRDATPAEVAFATILARESAELSATERLREELDEPHRLSTRVPQYLHGLHVHRGPEAHRQAEDWITTALPDHAEEIIDDDAWPALAHVLHEVHSAHEDPVALLVTRAAERPLTDDDLSPARSVAQVMHYRLVTDMPIAPPSPHRPELLPGWITNPPDPNPGLYLADGTDPRDIAELDSWLRTQVRHIADRVHELGARVLTDQPAWSASLGDVPEDLIGREQWIRNAGQLAAVRERWHIPDTTTLLPDADGEQKRATEWALTYVREHPPAEAAAHAEQRADNEERDRARQRQEWKDRADAAAQRVRERQQRDHDRRLYRDTAEVLLRNVWRHEPVLVEKIVNGRGFDTLAQRLHEVAEAGLDVHEVLVEVSLEAVAAARVREPAFYTIALLDIAVDRIRTGQAQHDTDRHTRRVQFEQMRDQAADLLHEEWANHPHLAETVIHAPAFTAFVRVFDQYVDAGLDPRGLLADVPVAKLDTDHVRDPAAYAIYLLRNVAERHLHERDEAQQDAALRSARHVQQTGAAELLRHAWHRNPECAEAVITNPTFRHLAERMHAAHQQGHDVEALLRQLDPQALTAAHVPNPAGTTTFAFTQLTKNPPPAAADTRSTPHWKDREHGHLTDDQLRVLADQQTKRAEQLARQHHAERLHADTLFDQATNGTGRHVRALDEHFQRLQVQAKAIEQTQRLQNRWKEATEQAARAAEHRTHLEHSPRRHRNHPDAIRQAAAIEQSALHNARALARQAAVHQQLAGPPELHEETIKALEVGRADYAHDRQNAEQRDYEAAQRATHRLTERAAASAEVAAQLTHIHAEQSIRDTLAPDARHREGVERAALSREDPVHEIESDRDLKRSQQRQNRPESLPPAHEPEKVQNQEPTR